MFKSIQIVRPINLLIIVATMLLCRWSITNVSILEKLFIDPMLTNFWFILLVISTVCIAAAGYIVNDIYDVDMDRVNKPNKVIIGKYLSEKVAWYIYFVLSIIGVAIGFYIAEKLHMTKLGVLHVMMVALLFFYAHFIKRTLFWGNFIISFCTAFTVAILIFFDLDHVHDMNSTQATMYLGTYAALIGYTFFAFWTTFMREIIKDVEDMEGDNDFGCRSIPIVYGIYKTKWIVGALNAVLLVLYILFIVLFLENQYYIGMVVVLGLLILPTLFFQWKLKTAQTKPDFKYLSNILKSMMVFGVSTLLFLHNGMAAKIFISFFDLLGFNLI